MPRPRLPEGERRRSTTIILREKTIEALKKIPNYNKIIEQFVEELIKKNN